ncbi:methylenetetrahydrofolate reductase [Nesterenkonia halotolerans]|uniref:methylenetetrahydrofolate reductase n=1 Tax=Nesterenkonia halotolerans TaxID=225325 RepID=UPI003EE61717
MAMNSDSTASVMTDPSLEMTGKDVDALLAAAPKIRPGTRVNVTFLGNENLEMRVAAAKAVHDAGLTPVSHVAARRMSSKDEFVEFLDALRGQVGTTHLFTVGGDPSEPMGPYASALDLIGSGLPAEHGFTHISIAGYPEGHPDIADSELWSVLEAKVAALQEQGLSGTILTQFGFDVDPIHDWIREVRARGIDLPIRIGVPGPAGIKRLMTYAKRFGVSTSAGIARKYGFSMTNLLGTAGPERLIRDLQKGLTAESGDVKLHFYTFGGMETTADWIADYDERQLGS